MEGKRRDEEEIQDGLVVEEIMMVNFPLVPFPSLELLLRGSSRQGEVKQAHKETYIMHHQLDFFLPSC